MVALVWGPAVSTAPVISDIFEVEEAPGNVQVSWNLDQPAQGWIAWGYASGGPYPNETTRETSLTYTSHSQVVGTVAPATTFYYVIYAVNAANQTTVSSEGSFTTAGDVVVDDDFDLGYTYTDYTVPTGAGYTDGSDARSALQTWLNARPSGSSATSHTRIVFPAGYTWNISGILNLSGKSHWTIEGGGTEATYGCTGGATIARVGGFGPGTEEGGHFAASHWGSGSTYSCEDIRFHCLNIVGNSPTGRYSTAVSDLPTKNHGVTFRGCDGGRVSHCNFSRLRGDGVYLSAPAGSGSARALGILIDGNLIEDNERMGVALINCSDTVIRDNKFSDIFYAAIDFEPNTSVELIHNTTISGNLFADIWSWGTSYNDGCIKADSPQAPGTTGFVLIENNTVTGSPQGGSGPFFDARYSAPGYTYVKTATLTIRNNTCTLARSGPVVRLKDWTTSPITITGNTGFKTATGSWVSNEGNNGTITQSGNT